MYSMVVAAFIADGKISVASTDECDPTHLSPIVRWLSLVKK